LDRTGSGINFSVTLNYILGFFCVELKWFLVALWLPDALFLVEAGV